MDFQRISLTLPTLTILNNTNFFRSLLVPRNYPLLGPKMVVTHPVQKMPNRDLFLFYFLCFELKNFNWHAWGNRLVLTIKLYHIKAEPHFPLLFLAFLHGANVERIIYWKVTCIKLNLSPNQLYLSLFVFLLAIKHTKKKNTLISLKALQFSSDRVQEKNSCNVFSATEQKLITSCCRSFRFLSVHLGDTQNSFASSSMLLHPL